MTGTKEPTARQRVPSNEVDVLLVGDAAHVFPPGSGMGLNVALQDDVTAARCLAQVIKDSAAPDTLSSRGIFF